MKWTLRLPGPGEQARYGGSKHQCSIDFIKNAGEDLEDLTYSLRLVANLNTHAQAINDACQSLWIKDKTLQSPKGVE